MKAQNKKTKRNLIRLIVLCIAIICVSASIILASESDPNCLVPEENQYFELRGVEVKDIDGQNKQLIMELWGNNIEFKRT